ncbi:MAG: CpcT/CpeT family chromophore lyase [Aliidiomarina sp.]|uniref:CpcT/CpeT family chromophore lyase n=1 Tax=Aliidiomarina sp. TaxID=1872439 RepID=UPI0025BEE32B|nr:CpcT/CpeT family chromophore lyase [Aliidiomarina sp.]MCH8501391.1 CpcT/CpeT family chromophore lyase [Aliidiomarina sp.]
MIFSIVKPIAKVFFFLVTSLFFVNAAATDQSQDKEITRLLDWLAGDFSNLRYILESGGSGHPPILLRQQLVSRDDENPALLVEQSWINQPEESYRYQLFTFRKVRTGEIIQSIAVLSSSEFQDIQAGDVQFSDYAPLRNCEIIWREEDGLFNGFRDPERCRFSDQHGELVHWQTRLTVTPHQYIVDDFAVTAQGETILGQVDGVPVVNERIRFFVADIEFLPAGADASSDDAWVEVQPRQTLHDHEQRIALMDSKGEFFYGHDIQLFGKADQPEYLKVRLYRQNEESPLAELTTVYQDGEWRAQGERIRLRLRQDRDVY